MIEIIITCLRYIIAVGALTASGWSIIYAAEKMFSRDGYALFMGYERWFLGFPAGSGLFAWYLFLIGVARIPFVMGSMLPFFLLPIAAWIFSKKKQLRTMEKKVTPPITLIQKYILIFAGILFVLRLVFIVFEISVVPTYFEDSAAHWNQRAKIFYDAKGFLLDKESSDFFGKYRTEYPLYTHTMKIYLSEAAGGWFEPVVNSLNLLLLVSLLGFAVISLVRLTGNIFVSLFAGYAIGSIPLASHQLFGGLYSDFAFGLFIFTGFVLFMRWAENPARGGYVWFSSFFFALAAFTKIEPVILAFPPIFLALWIAGRNQGMPLRKSALPFWGIIALYLGPWLLLKFVLGLPFLPSGGAPGGLFTPRLDLVPHMVRVLLFEGNYNVFFVGVGFVGIFIWRHFFSGIAKYGTIFVSLFLSLILFVFLFTGSSQWLEDETTFHRTMIAFLPSLIFLLALASSEFLQTKKKQSL